MSNKRYSLVEGNENRSDEEEAEILVVWIIRDANGGINAVFDNEESSQKYLDSHPESIEMFSIWVRQ